MPATIPVTSGGKHSDRKRPRSREGMTSIQEFHDEDPHGPDPSHDQLGDTGRKTGFWLAEFVDALLHLPPRCGSGRDRRFAEGGQPPLDPVSDTPEGQTEFTRRFKQDAAAQAVLANTSRLSHVHASDYDAVFYPGGHGPMRDLAEDPHSIALIEAFYNSGKPVAAVSPCARRTPSRHVPGPSRSWRASG